MRTPLADEAIARLYDEHSRAMLLYARQWVGSAPAEDVVQRVFVRLLSHGRLPAEPRTWLFKCVRNEVIDAWRIEQRRRSREKAVANDTQGWFVPSPQDAIDASQAQAALASLPPELREVVTLRLWSGLSLSEIADVTDVVVSTVHKRYEAAIASLRKKLEHPCQTPKT